MRLNANGALGVLFGLGAEGSGRKRKVHVRLARLRRAHLGAGRLRVVMHRMDSEHILQYVGTTHAVQGGRTKMCATLMAFPTTQRLLFDDG